MKKSDERIIYVLCCPFVKTGGTELLHQLVYKLNSLGINSKIVYEISKDGKYLNPAFEEYVNEYLIETDIIDDENNILVIPEVYTYYIKKYNKVQMYLWWLSVDNYLKNNTTNFIKLLNFYKEEYGYLRAVLETMSRYIKKKHRIKRSLPIRQMSNVKLHMVQSIYAYDFLKKQGVNNIEYLSDYINDSYITKSKNIDIAKKENIVVYNPKKGKRYTRHILENCENIKFVALEGMTNLQLQEVLEKAKIYIDFGGHPGKDRFPREAALMNCCIITGRRGSANYDDVLIEDKYKFEDKKKNISLIIECIENTLDNYDSCIEDFKNYKDKILDEKNQFELEMKRIFCKNISE